MKFCNLLTQYRERAGLTKTELAKKIGVTVSYIIDLEAGRKKPPTIERIEQIINIFSLSKKEAMELLNSAAEERILKKDIRFFQIGRLKPGLPSDIQKIPVISWVYANRFADVEDPFPPGIADQYVYTTTRGKHIFGLRVIDDCMEPEFREGDIIIVKPYVDVVSNNYVIVRDEKSNQATFKQYKKYGRKIILHPLNPKYNDIELDTDSERYSIVGKVIEKIKKY